MSYILQDIRISTRKLSSSQTSSRLSRQKKYKMQRPHWGVSHDCLTTHLRFFALCSDVMWWHLPPVMCLYSSWLKNCRLMRWSIGSILFVKVKIIEVGPTPVLGSCATGCVTLQFFYSNFSEAFLWEEFNWQMNLHWYALLSLSKADDSCIF